VALVDGNNHQIDRIHAEAKDRGVTVTVLLDFVHILGYLVCATRRCAVSPRRAGRDWRNVPGSNLGLTRGARVQCPSTPVKCRTGWRRSRP